MPASSREVPLISSYNVLDLIAAQNAQGSAIVFHGTPSQLERIDPRHCKAWRHSQWISDSLEPVVCATEEPVIAAFRALVPRTEQLFGCLRTRNQEGGLTFIVPESSRCQLLESIGYVAVCDQASFTPYNPAPKSNYPIISEYRSSEPVIPLCNIEIDFTDFEDLLYASPANQLRYM